MPTIHSYITLAKQHPTIRNLRACKFACKFMTISYIVYGLITAFMIFSVINSLTYHI